MKQKISLFVFALFFITTSLSLTMITGCAPVADPHQGGLFGYSPELYKQRAAEKEQRIQQLKADTAAQNIKNKEISAEVLIKNNELTTLKKKTNSLSTEISKLQKSLKKQEGKTANALEKKLEIESRLQKIKKESEHLYSSDIGLAEKMNEIERLKKEKERLQKEIELLSTMY